MRASSVKWLLFFALTVVFASSAYAEHLFGPDELDTTYGVVFRLRQELWENAFDLDTGGPAAQNRNFFRLKTTPWIKLDYDKKIGLMVKLTNEAKYYLNVSTFRPVSGSTSRFDEDELVFDNLYVDLNLQKLANLPVDLRIGRQDFLFTHGEGFLILDGTPGDGSRTFFFNAIKANIKFGENHNLDIIYLSDPLKDTYLPVLHSTRPPYGKVRLNTSDEQGFVLYSRNKLSKEFSIEPYYIYKKEEPFSSNAELDLNTLGIRAVYTTGGWRVRGEIARQFGEYDNGRDRKAYGGYLFVGRKYADVSLKPEFDLGYLFLSGDDPNSAEHEGWNPLFNRSPFVGPVYSELFIFTLTRETGADSAIPAYWTNLHILRAVGKVSLTGKTGLTLGYNYLWADEKTNFTSAPNSALFSNNSKDRGHLFQTILNHVFSKKVDGNLHFEYFIPGDFYTDAADNALFFRWQLQIKI